MVSFHRITHRRSPPGRTILPNESALCIVDGVEHGEPIAEDPSATPNPAVEVRQTLADGTPVKAVWSYVKSLDVAKLVTVHFFE